MATIRLSQYNEQAQVAPSVTRAGSVAVGFYNADATTPVHPGCFTPAEWDAFVAAGNAALGREAGPTVPRAAVAALRDRWSDIAKDFAQEVERDRGLRMIDGASKALTDVVAALDDLLATPGVSKP